MKRLLFIYNPHAGKELLKPKLSDIIDIFVKAGYEVVAIPPSHTGTHTGRCQSTIRMNMTW